MPVPWLQLGGSVLSVFGTSYAHVIKAVANGDIIYGPCELRVRAARKRNTTRCRVRRYGRSVGLSITADVTVAIEPIAIVEATQRLLYIDSRNLCKEYRDGNAKLLTPQNPPHLISVATLPCESDSRHLGLYCKAHSQLTTAI